MKTLLFSNIIGNIYESDDTARFNGYMEEYLTKNISPNSKLLFINAPGLGGEDNYLPNILRCFAKIGVSFAKVLVLNIDTPNNELDEFNEAGGETVYFLTGGNPLTQMEIIKKFDLTDAIKSYDGLVIGFCAGAINLSKHSIITTDADFDHPQSYEGIGRVPIVIEPHYNDSNDAARNEEIGTFAKELNEEIYAVPDASIVVVEDGSVKEFGEIYHIMES